MATATNSDEVPSEVDVLVIGAGVTGIYQLYRALEAGFSAAVLEAGDGVGGTWFWNRYPEARFDSESYTYGYFFSPELYTDWEWREHFAGQPETERYFNHVVDRFDLRRHIHVGNRVVSAIFDGGSGTWTVRTASGNEVRARFVVAATGVLSVPFFPATPGREDFRGESYHTGLWPATPVSFTGKRVAVIGTGASGVQLIPAIAADVASLTVYQRSPNWCTPLNNRPITQDEQAALKADFEYIRDTVNTSRSGFLHVQSERSGTEDSERDRWKVYEGVWESPGFSKLSSFYTDLMTDSIVNREWCEFIAQKIRSIVKDPVTADRLIPKDHRFGQKRPPFVTNYYETYNRPNVELIDLNATPITRVTAVGIETMEGVREFDVIVWATGFDFGTGALNRMGVRGRDGLALEEHWAAGPTTYLGIQCAGFPNFFFPGGPHGAAGNNPRYAGDQVDFVMDLLAHMRANGYDVIDVDPSAEEEWTTMMDTFAELGPFSDVSYFFGTNIPGKPRRYLLNAAGRPKLREMMADAARNDYSPYLFRRSSREEVRQTDE
jgi:cation diffusion facilitator CzcD-associated flavoprotein CzcO